MKKLNHSPLPTSSVQILTNLKNSHLMMCAGKLNLTICICMQIFISTSNIASLCGQWIHFLTTSVHGKAVKGKAIL